MKRNPREVRWTVLYRRKHKKGTIEEQSKRRTRKTQKYNRAYTGATLDQILQKRNQTSEVRKAQRDQAIRYITTVKNCRPLSGVYYFRAAKEKAASKKKQKVQAAAKVSKTCKFDDNAIISNRGWDNKQYGAEMR